MTQPLPDITAADTVTAMQTKLDVTITTEQAMVLVPAFNPEQRTDRTDQALVDAVAHAVGLNYSTGGWIWRIAVKDGNVKLTARLVPATGSVVG